MPEEVFETPQPTQPTEPKTTNWPRIILAAVSGFVLLATTAYAGYWYGTQQNQPIQGGVHLQTAGAPELEFSSTPCDQEVNPYEQSGLGVRKLEWLDETTLQVQVYVSVNCAEEIEKGDYEIANNKIILKYISPKCTLCVKCMCARRLIYKFTGIEKKDYQFEVERVY